MGFESLLTFQQAAERSGCCPKMLRRAVSSGDLAVIRLGSSAKSDRIHPDDLAAFWASRRYTPPALPKIQTFARPAPSPDSAEERLAKLLAIKSPRQAVPRPKRAPPAK